MQLREGSKPYHTNHSIVYSCQYHVIFCPKYRRPVLAGAVGERCKELVLSKQDEYGYTVMELAVMPEHVHLLLDVDPRIGIASLKIDGYTVMELEVMPEHVHLHRRIARVEQRHDQR